ncbi:MAG: hypothetical protein A2147_09865 [Chloroflexi bacterium RBG_16_57_8]|nr:MAG: hypothetical protein A2147_09865 [Chloroflexi bacterium RBG_16_57_8]
MTCPECGFENLSWLSRCQVCGERLHKEEEVELPARSRKSFLPKTLLGRWSVGLAGASVVLTLTAVLVVFLLRSQLTDANVQPSLALLAVGSAGMVGYFLGIAAWIIGLISIWKSRERSILVFAVVLVGLSASVGLFYLASNI